METMISIIFFHVVMVLSAAEEEEKNLAAVVGGNITLPDPLMEMGYLYYGRIYESGKIIAEVENSNLVIFYDSYRNKVHWNQTSGLFTITDLQRNDSGVYKLDSKKGRRFLSSYTVTVYEPVETPAVTRLNVSSDSCWLECLVKKQQSRLSWYKDEEVVEQSSSAFSLNLSVHKQDVSSSFRCVAASPAEETSLPVNVSTSCWTDSKDQEGTSITYIWTLIGLLITLVVIIPPAVCVIKKCCERNKSSTTQTQADSESREADIQYSEIRIFAGRRTQGGNSAEAAGKVDDSNLTSVYDKLEVHRMVLTQPAHLHS